MGIMKLCTIFGLTLTMGYSFAEGLTNHDGKWDRLIRFRDANNVVRYGEPIVDSGDDVIPAYERGTLEAVVLECDKFLQCGHRRSQTLHVRELLSPLTASDVPIVRCMALNYPSHVNQTGSKPPPYPSEFIKGRTAVAQWNDPVLVPLITENNSTDFEGELAFVVSKNAKDIRKEEVVDYIGGFFVGNDVSNRKWQIDPAFAGTQPQFDFSKGFDGWAPYGPVIVSPSIVGLGENLTLTTTVNGNLRQNSPTSAMIFNVAEILSFISQGTTIEAGTVFMTGTPAGAGLGTGIYINDGDIVQVNITELGHVKNKYVFQSRP